MSLKSQWNPSDVSNRIIVEDLRIRYTTDEEYYTIPPKGDASQEPAYVTNAKEKVDASSLKVTEAQESRDALDEDLEEAQHDVDIAYANWHADMTFAKYCAWNQKRITLYAVHSQIANADEVVFRMTREYNAALSDLAEANKRWSVEREDVYYKGARLIGFVYHRFATMRLKYVGFSKSAADRCRDSLENFYTRTISKSAVFNDGEIEVLNQIANPSTVKAVHANGDNYTVEVEVNEDDVKASTNLVEASTLFVSENHRRYFIESA